MITYDNFWKTMKEKGISQYRLINYHEISTSLIHRLKKNLPINTTTIDRLCEIIGCDVADILTYTPNETIGIDLDYGSYVASDKEYQSSEIEAINPKEQS